ncbi:MAG: TetR/AcrR family transcriptional regulator [Rhodospirillales bacterium]|nr:TetR/AcrR family transcriptional regulator [Rhodospirillales bacterium]
MATTTAKRPPNRWPALLDAAAAQFAGQGYHATTIRDLATAAAMTPGAIYFFVPTKQALLLAVYEEGVQRILQRVEAAVAGEARPWERLEKAVLAHLESVLDASAYARVVIRIVPGDVPEIAAAIIALRERYEDRFRRLFADIALPPRHDATLARLFLLGAINWTPVWYRAGGGHDLPAIAHELLAPLRALVGRGPERSRP